MQRSHRSDGFCPNQIVCLHSLSVIIPSVKNKRSRESYRPGPVKCTSLSECGDLAESLLHSLAGILSRCHKIVDTGIRDHSDLPAH